MWVLDGATGEIGFGWPVRVDNQISGATLVTQLYGLDKMLFVSFSINNYSVATVWLLAVLSQSWKLLSLEILFCCYYFQQ